MYVIFRVLSVITSILATVTSIKLLKKKTGWDWDAKEKSWLKSLKISISEFGSYIITYPDGLVVDNGFTGNVANELTGGIIIDKYLESQEKLRLDPVYMEFYFIPLPIPVSIPSFIPVFIY